jgi:transcriptional regulator with PAS, ATPase and Fis domain
MSEPTAELGGGGAPPDETACGTLEEMQRGRILEALARNGGNKPAVAAELGISLRTLYNRVHEYRQQGYMP